MSIFRRHQTRAWDATSLIAAERSGRTSSRMVRQEQALRHSAVWAARRLRADLISTMPVDVYAKVSGVRVERPTPPVLVEPGASGGPDRVDVTEWLYSTQFDLDGVGNTVGLVAERDGRNLPARIDLVPIDEVTVQVRKGQVSYRIGGDTYSDPSLVWHERQFTTSGSPVGLSPIAYAAASLLGYLSAQEFAADWFSRSGVPAARLKNTAKKIDAKEAQVVKARFKASVEAGDLFVHGSDWDYEMIAAKASETAFIDAMKFGIGDAARFMGVPGDMLDAETSSGSITYANVTQRNLQLLILNIGPAVTRREKALTRLTPRPWYVKLNSDALLRMDLASRYAAYGVGIDKRFLAPSEARALEDSPPFTDEQLAEFAALFPSRSAAVAAPGDTQEGTP